MVTLTPKDRKSGKTYYEPALLKVRGKSQYNADQISFEGLDGFWQWTEWAAKTTEREAPPPEGTVAWFYLADKPKQGNNAKPGSMYRDIMGVKAASAEDKAAYRPPRS